MAKDKDKNVMRVLAVAALVLAAAATVACGRVEESAADPMPPGITEPAPPAPSVKSETAYEAEKKIATLYMPDIVGKSEAGALQKLEDMGFYNVKVEYGPSPEYEKGFVYRQSIPPDTTAGTDFEIILYISE